MQAAIASLEETVREWLRTFSFHEVIDPMRSVFLPDACKPFLGGNACKAVIQARRMKVFVFVLERMPVCSLSESQIARKPDNGILRWFADVITTYKRTKVASDQYLPFRFQSEGSQSRQRVFILPEENVFHGYCVQQTLEYDIADLRPSPPLFT